MINFTIKKDELALITAKQFIADIYHCSESWGVRMTADEMKESLQQWASELAPDEHVPDVSLAADLATYWNELCRSHPA